MKSKKKVLVTLLCAALLVFASVMGTMAYLQDKETVTNTFTVGNVDITLDEADVNEKGEWVNGHDSRTNGNEYRLYPGHTYKKDPTVTVKAGSDESYVRMLVTINEQKDLDAIFAPNGLPLNEFFGGVSEDWELVAETENANDTRTYVFNYKETVTAMGDKVVLDDLFETITVPSTITKEQLATISDLQIDVVAQAIQADGFDTAEAAWANFNPNL